MRRWKSWAATLALLTVVLALGSGPGHACFTGLTVIPTSEVMDRGDYGIELQYDGVFASAGDEARVVNTEFGLARNLEAGVDFDLSPDSEARVLLNAKYRLFAPEDNPASFAIGVCNVGHGSKSSPYLVGSYALKQANAHLGLVRSEGATRWFSGVDYALTDQMSLYGDYTSGDESFASIGGSYQFSDRYGLMAGVLLPNASDEATEFKVHFVIGGSFRHSGKGE
jgi:hypothetical protein